jgi:hypothetical protein
MRISPFEKYHHRILDTIYPKLNPKRAKYPT